jgi:hypothetical protein
VFFRDETESVVKLFRDEISSIFRANIGIDFASNAELGEGNKKC